MEQCSTIALEDGTDREFRNVGIQLYTDAGDLPKRKETTRQTLLLY